MKLTSRKALVAAATALALTTSGMSAPAFAEETAPAGETANQVDNNEDAGNKEDAGNNDDAGNKDEKKDFFSGLSSNNDNKDDADKGSSIKDTTPEQWRTWIGLFTAIIGALSAGFAFVQKYLK